MDKEDRIAVASSDGIVVNSHFGRAKEFYIYLVDQDEQISFLEKRAVVPVCDRGNHDQERLSENLQKIKDCNYLLVSRIGDEAERIAKEYGIDSYEIPGVITESIEQLIKYTKIKKLFE